MVCLMFWPLTQSSPLLKQVNSMVIALAKLQVVMTGLHVTAFAVFVHVKIPEPGGFSYLIHLLAFGVIVMTALLKQDSLSGQFGGVPQSPLWVDC